MDEKEQTIFSNEDNPLLSRQILQGVIEAIEAIMDSKQDLHKIAEQIAGGLFTIGEGMSEVVVGAALAMKLAKDIALGLSSRKMIVIEREDVQDYASALEYGIKRVTELRADAS
jgi:hypothetical protein